MKTSFTTMGTQGLSVEEIVEVAKKYGFDGVDFRVHENGEIPLDVTKEQAKDIKEKLKGIALPGLFCYNKTLNDGEKEMEGSVLRCLEIGEMLGCESIRLFTGKLETNEDINSLCNVLENVLEKYKGKTKIYLQHHTMNSLNCSQAIEIFKRLDKEKCGFIFSPDEGYKMDEDYMPLIPEIAKFTKQIYVADITKDKKYCLIGEGIIPFNEIINTLKTNGFDGYVTLKWEKCWCDYLPDYPEGFKSFVDYIK